MSAVRACYHDVVVRVPARMVALVLVLGLHASTARAEPTREELEAAREAYDRGAAAYDRGDFARASSELGRADQLVPNDVALDLAIRAAVKADEPVAAMTLAARAEARVGSATLVAARDLARAKMGGRVGQVLVTCGPYRCAATLDAAPHAVEQRAYVLAGRHEVVIEVDGQRRRSSIDVAGGGVVELRAQPPPAVAPLAPTPVAAPPASPARESPPGARDGLSPGWFWVGVGVTTALGGTALASALDTRGKHDDFVVRPSQQLADDGAAAQLRTNLLGVGVAVSAVATAALGLFLVRWGDAPPRRPDSGTHKGPMAVRR